MATDTIEANLHLASGHTHVSILHIHKGLSQLDGLAELLSRAEPYLRVVSRHDPVQGFSLIAKASIEVIVLPNTKGGLGETEPVFVRTQSGKNVKGGLLNEVANQRFSDLVQTRWLPVRTEQGVMLLNSDRVELIRK
jgi:hypothetical protein